jgi:hypothetical protein
MNSSRQKLNVLWFWIAGFAGLFAGGVFGSLIVAVVVFGLVYVVLLSNGNVRLSSRGGGRGRRP